MIDLLRISEWPSDEGGEPRRVRQRSRFPSYAIVEFIGGTWMVGQRLTVQEARRIASLLPATDPAVIQLDEAAARAERYNALDAGP